MKYEAVPSGACTFNMVNMAARAKEISSNSSSLSAAPLLDDDSPCSVICEQELQILLNDISTNFIGTYDDLTYEISHRPF